MTPPRLIRAWKRSFAASMVDHGGHLIAGSDLRLSPEKMALRHYIVSSQDHAFAKYTGRRFADSDRALGWHGNRVNVRAESFVFPSVAELSWLSHAAERALVTVKPRNLHYWQWPCSRDAVASRTYVTAL